MGYYWLNHREEEKSGYRDKEGEVYHYRSQVPGSKKFSEGDWFVYYRPGGHYLFGAGRVSEIEVIGEKTEPTESAIAKLQPMYTDSRTYKEYLAHVGDYRQFDPPVMARDIKENVSFLKGKKGLTGVPQNSIFEIDEVDYRLILEAAGEEDLLNVV